jgi:hypothetical protein
MEEGGGQRQRITMDRIDYGIIRHLLRTIRSGRVKLEDAFQQCSARQATSSNMDVLRC